MGARASDAGGDPDEARQSRFWKGILHASPPIWELNFRPPTPVRPGQRSGTPRALVSRRSSSPPAFRAAGQDAEGEEDCLTLKLRAPAQPTAPTPVLFWFYGGALPHGSGSLYDGAWLAEVCDAVVVTVNYRLDPPALDNLAGLPPATPMSPADLAVTATLHSWTTRPRVVYDPRRQCRLLSWTTS